MLRNVISSFTLKMFGALKLISWKYTYKRLNEEYELAKKKKQALDNLYESGKISQSTRDSFTSGINDAMVQIENQQKELIESMQLKTQELENQIKTLETLLANYEIQHVVGEIDEQIYQQEIALLTTGLETTRNELNVIKQSTTQLCSPPSIQAPAAPEPVAPVVEAEVVQPAAVEPTPVEVPVQAAPVETAIETPTAPAPVETAPEITIEPAKAEVAPVESAPAEITPAEVAPIETAPAAIETPVENTPVETAPIIETAPVEVVPVETPTVELAPVETAPIASPEPEVQVINEPTPEVAPQEQAITEPAPQEPDINLEAAAPIEQPAVEAETEDVTPTEVIAEAEPEQPEAKVSLQDFEVIPEAKPIETTLEEVIETIIEPAVETTTLAHPLEAPQVGQTETEQSSEEAAAETEDSSEEKT